MGGSAVLEMLQIADVAGVATPAASPTQPEAVVKMADIMRIAGADANRWRGDPQALRVPARGASSPAFADRRARLVGGALPDSTIAGETRGRSIRQCAVAARARASTPYPALPPATRSAE
jgi:gamma-glutamyltranspeptidase / glutathione hydrolase